MVSLYLDPNGENVFSHSLPTNHPTNNGNTTANESAEETISTLRARIKELESNKVITQEVSMTVHISQYTKFLDILH